MILNTVEWPKNEADQNVRQDIKRSSTRAARLRDRLLRSLFLGDEKAEGIRADGPQDDPLGLTVLHAPETQAHTIDILFIHGLGGTSIRTWCRNRDPEFFWPKKWLPAEADLAGARMLSFGYNAHFSVRRRQTVLTINDFAADLLYSMKYSAGEGGEMGQVPIIVVAHSMGGLVFKRACECDPYIPKRLSHSL